MWHSEGYGKDNYHIYLARAANDKDRYDGYNDDNDNNDDVILIMRAFSFYFT